ncbi:MAG: glycosyltransferase family 2 protein [Janthinobacterium lividum]
MHTKDRPVLLARALASVCSQTYSDWHLYLVNDGGDARQVEQVLDVYRSLFAERITVLHHSDSQGMEAASNAALECSESDFLVIHDDDDSWHPRFLAETTSFLNAPEHNGYAAVITHTVVVYEHIEDDCVVEDRRADWANALRSVDFFKMLQTNQFPPVSCLMRRSVVDHIGRFNTALPVLGDWDYNLRIMLVGDIGVLQKKLAHYHHRTPLVTDAYGNSVGAGVAHHELYNTLYRNSLIRQFAKGDLANLALINGLTQHTVWIDDMRSRLTHIENVVAEIAHLGTRAATVLGVVEKALRIPRGLWYRLLPFRRVVARARGRV